MIKFGIISLTSLSGLVCGFLFEQTLDPFLIFILVFSTYYFYYEYKEYKVFKEVKQ